MSRRVVITKHRRWYSILHDFCTVANSSQHQFFIDLLDLPQRERTPFFPERVRASELRIAGLAVKARYGIRDDDLLLIILDGLVYDDEELDEDLFSLCSEDLSAPGLGVLSLHYLTGDPSWEKAPLDLVANSIMLNLLCSLAENLTDLRCHSAPSGCV